MTKEERKKYYQKNRENIRKKNREWYLKNKLKRNVYGRKYYQEHCDKAKDWNQDYRWKNEYHIINNDGSQFTTEDYNKHFFSQDGKCKTCGKHQTELTRRLHADHDHLTGKIRGLLCHGCNVILGNAQDKKEILENLIAYLKQSQGEPI